MPSGGGGGPLGGSGTAAVRTPPSITWTGRGGSALAAATAAAGRDSPLPAAMPPPRADSPALVASGGGVVTTSPSGGGGWAPGNSAAVLASHELHTPDRLPPTPAAVVGQRLHAHAPHHGDDRMGGGSGDARLRQLGTSGSLGLASKVSLVGVANPKDLLMKTLALLETENAVRACVRACVRVCVRAYVWLGLRTCVGVAAQPLAVVFVGT